MALVVKVTVYNVRLNRGYKQGFDSLSARLRKKVITMLWIVLFGVKGYRGRLQDQRIFDNQKDAEKFANRWRATSKRYWAEVL